MLVLNTAEVEETAPTSDNFLRVCIHFGANVLAILTPHHRDGINGGFAIQKKLQVYAVSGANPKRSKMGSMY